MSVDVLYLCHGRRRFTEKTLATLLETTNWGLVNRFVVYNDAAPDMHETTSMLHSMLPEGTELRLTNLKSPVAVMNHYNWRADADFFAKIDNDIMAPPGWLEALLGVMEHDPELELLGMEAGMSQRRYAEHTEGDCYTYTPSSHIGGVGLIRRSVFERFPYPHANGRFGFTEWQHRYEPVRGWIEPDLRVFELDKLPLDPWRKLFQEYRQIDGLQRDWSSYPEDMFEHWAWADV